MKHHPTVFLFIYFLMATTCLSAQYEYVVTTLIPENTHVIDDGLAIDENGTVYGSYWGIWQGAAGRHILRYYPEGTYDTLATGLVRPNGIAYHNGTVYIANGGASQLVAVAPDGSSSVVANVPGISNVVPVPGTDSLIAASWGQHKVLGINAAGEVSTVSSSPLYSGPVGATYDNAGNLYVANFNNGKIMKVQDGLAEVFADIGGGIGFITYSDGAILATNHTNKTVHRIPLNGIGTQIIAGSGQAVIEDGTGLKASFRSPNGIVATPSGDTIYISEFAGKALRMIIRTESSINSTQTMEYQETYKAFPVPGNGMVAFDPPLPHYAATAILSDSNGMILKTLSAEALATNQIDCTGLSAGLYTLTVYSEERQLITKAKLIIAN